MKRLLGIGIALVLLLLFTGPVSAYPRAVVFTFDNARASVYTVGYPIFADHGYKATFYVVTDGVDVRNTSGDSITLSQLTTLYNAGWDIGDHTRHHEYFVSESLGLSEQIAEIQGGRDDLEAWGFTRASRHLAFPGGEYDADTTTAMTSAGMLTGRTIEPTPLTIPLFNNDTFHLTGVRWDLDPAYEDEQYTYLESLSSDNVVIYLTHGVDDPSAGASSTTSTMLGHMLDYMSVHHIPVWTITQLYTNISAPRLHRLPRFPAYRSAVLTPLTVAFTDSSTGSSITSHRWDFGDGNISDYATPTNPSHRYTSAGTYSVHLTVTNAGGSASLPRSNYITVTAPPAAPIANFTATPLGGTGPLSVSFTDTSTSSPASWRWAYKNATVGWTQFAATRNPTFTFPAGTYDINLTATNADGSGNEVRTGYINVTPGVVIPDANFTATPLGGTGPLECIVHGYLNQFPGFLEMDV